MRIRVDARRQRAQRRRSVAQARARGVGRGPRVGMSERNTMRMGVVVSNQAATVARVAAQLARVEALGYDSAWMPGIPNGPDPLVLLALAGRATTRLELGP